MLKIGIIREGKTPPDSRVPLTPAHCEKILATHSNIEIVVQPSPSRCFSDDEYKALSIPMQEDLADCDVLMGVKEVPIEQLLTSKTYLFFSHTIKAQSYNRDLLLAILAKNVDLIDYESLTHKNGQRLIAFGEFAGMVGAHNALWTYGQRTGLYSLKRMHECFDYAEAQSLYRQLSLPKVKIVLTGDGRVANGAAKVLEDMGILKISAPDYVNNTYDQAVFTQLACAQYARRKDGANFDLAHFFKHPAHYQSSFEPYTNVSDIMINGIYWDNDAPAFFTLKAMRQKAFKIQVISDVTCDIAPISSIPSTLRATTIADPVFGFDPHLEQEVAPYQASSIDMMTIDYLPNELPRDASTNFGQQFIDQVLLELLDRDHSDVIERALVTKAGELGQHFTYLQPYVDGGQGD